MKTTKEVKAVEKLRAKLNNTLIRYKKKKEKWITKYPSGVPPDNEIVFVNIVLDFFVSLVEFSRDEDIVKNINCFLKYGWSDQTDYVDPEYVYKLTRLAVTRVRKMVKKILQECGCEEA